ncbi:hypothetical protein K0U07_01875 [bacterium]|nr:hypothetical protein [bacterium]
MKKRYLILLFSCSLLVAKDFTTEITTREEECFEFLFSSLAKKSIWGLLANKSKLEKMGDEIRSVPPLAFLSFMVKDPTLFENMTRVEKDGDRFRWGHFIRDFKKTCNGKEMYQMIVAELDDFAEDVGIPAEELRPFVQEKHWSNLIRHLLKRKRV